MSMELAGEAEDLRRHSRWFAVYGILFIVLGVFSILAPGIATLALELMIGWLLLFGGGFGLVAVLSSGRGAPSFWWNLLTAIIYALAGLALLARPVTGVITLTIILASYLLAGGIIRLMLAIGYRKRIPGAWVWILISGLVDIVLGYIIVAGMPGSAAWVLGLLVGINLLMLGTSILIAALALRRNDDRARQATSARG